jgi:16S rRNA (cytidine1402-2'-O)-methyltransferase
MQSIEKGALYIVATPIGNLADISKRALDVLSQVDWVAAEDTRHSQKLLQHFAINKPLISLHEHNETERAQSLIDKLKQGESGALISDAGTPLISDPGYVLVKALRDQGLEVRPIPGASAMIAALSVAGLPTDRFSFEGFLPAKANKRQTVLQALQSQTQTLVFYESPHRLMDCLLSLKTVLGESRRITVAREMTKQYEQFVSGNLAEAVAFFEAFPDKVRGEFVLVVEGAKHESEDESDQNDWNDLIDILLKQGLPVKQISEIVAEYFQVKKNTVYPQVQARKDAQ